MKHIIHLSLSITMQILQLKKNNCLSTYSYRIHFLLAEKNHVRILDYNNQMKYFIINATILKIDM